MTWCLLTRKPTSTLSWIEDDRIDDSWMASSLRLVDRSIALAHPNPRVGAILVKNGEKVGEGVHQYDQRDHAEVVALKQAGGKARGATLYVTLEPCCTTGRTGPCTKAIIAAGVKRVVAAMKDPNPVVAGRGIEELKRAGIAVQVTADQERAKQLNEDFAKWIQTRLPFVTLKCALTLDGQIAARGDRGTRITGVPSRLAVHRLRHAADGLLTGIGTVLADNPRLTDRSGEPRRRRLLRAVVDTRLRLPLKSKLISSAKGDLIVFTTEPSDSPKAHALGRAGVEVFSVRPCRGRVDLRAVLSELGKRDILNLMIEAGAELNGAALESRIVDKMVLFYAPRVMGSGVPMTRMATHGFPKSPRLTNLVLDRCGCDFVVQGYFHDVYRNHGTRREN